MSLSRLCLRIATTQALLGQTVAADRVRDSSIIDLENAILKEPQSIILVYTDDTEFVPDGDRVIWGGSGTTSLVLILAIAGVNVLTDGTSEFVFPTTDKATEVTLDIAERQVQAALMNPANPWAERWKGIVSKVTRYQSRRGASTKEGVRYAARQIIIDCETYHDPIPGQPVEGEWVKFLDLLGASGTDLAQLADPLRVLMENPSMVDWQRDMAENGISRETLAGIGLAPFLFHPTPQAPATAILETIVATDGHGDFEIQDDE